MKKEDIPGFNAVVRSMDLKDIKLVSANALDNVDGHLPKDIKLDLKTAIKHTVGDEQLVDFYVENTFKVVEGRSVLIKIVAEYKLLYSMKGEHEEKYLNMFGEKSATTAIWGFYREFVNSMITQMGYPKLILPLLKR